MSLRTVVERTDFFELGRAFVLGFFEGIGRILDAIGGTYVDAPGPLAIEAQRAYESARIHPVRLGPYREPHTDKPPPMPLPGPGKNVRM